MPRNQYPQWAAQQRASKYPFLDNAELLTDSGYTLPNDLFYDASVVLSQLTGPLRLSRIYREDAIARLEFSDDLNPVIASASVNIAEASNRVRVLNSQGLLAGVFMSQDSRLAWFQTLPQGIHTLVESAVVVPSVVVTVPAVSTPQDTYLVGSDGVQLTCEPAKDIDADGKLIDVTLIRVHVVGDPLFVRARCDSDNFQSPRFVRTVIFRQGTMEHACNGDADGNVTIIGTSSNSADAAIRVRPTANGLQVGYAGPSNL